MFPVLLLTIFFFATTGFTKGYYWREYSGAIPKDAYPAGKNIAGTNVYIGQVYIKNAGLVPVQITPEETEVIAAIGGARKAKKYIKILCGLPQSFYWIRSNATTLLRDIEGKNAVIGGHEDSYGTVNIGRIFSQGETLIGKINSFDDSATFYYIQNEEEKSLKSYEVLLTTEEDSDIGATDLPAKQNCTVPQKTKN